MSIFEYDAEKEIRLFRQAERELAREEARAELSEEIRKEVREEARKETLKILVYSLKKYMLSWDEVYKEITSYEVYKDITKEEIEAIYSQKGDFFIRSISDVSSSKHPSIREDK